MQSPPVRLLSFALAVSLLAGCSGGGDGGADDATGEPDAGEVVVPDGSVESVTIDAFEVIENPTNTLSRIVEWRTTPATTGTLAVDCGDGAYTPSFDLEATADGEAFVMGMWEGAACQFDLEVEAGDKTATATREVEVGELPDFLPELEATTSKPEQMQSGWTVFNLNNSFDNVPLILAMVDARGRYRWYHRRDTSGSGAATSVTPMEEGLLVGGTHDTGRIWPAIIGWDGELIWEEELNMHHDIRPWEDDKVLYLTYADDCPDGIPGSSAIIEWDRSEAEETWRWEFCDHYTPENPRGDWDHTNAIEPFPNEDALLISARDQSALFKVDRQTGEVVWRLGVDGDFERTDGDDPAFLRQHAPEIQENGNILLFDNGSQNRKFSRAVELSYDTESMTMEVVWTYRPDPDIYAGIWSDADRLANGNTLSAFGRRLEDAGSYIHEVTADGTLVWALESPNKWGWYRADRIADPPSGFVR